jgi:hypothetical protein
MNGEISHNNSSVSKYFGVKVIWSVISGDMNAPVFIGIVILACLFGIDIATTSIGLSLGASEANDLMVRFVGTPFTHFFVKWLVVVLMAITVRWCDEIIPGVGLNFLAVLIGWYSFTVANNIHVIMGLTS